MAESKSIEKSLSPAVTYSQKIESSIGRPNQTTFLLKVYSTIINVFGCFLGSLALPDFSQRPLQCFTSVLKFQYRACFIGILNLIRFCTMVKSHHWELLPSGVGLPSHL